MESSASPKALNATQQAINKDVMKFIVELRQASDKCSEPTAIGLNQFADTLEADLSEKEATS